MNELEKYAKYSKVDSIELFWCITVYNKGFLCKYKI